MKNYFPDSELKCKCGNCDFKFSDSTRERLNKLREIVGAIIVNSGYRCAAYNDEIGATQTHATGQAIDAKCSHKQAFMIMKEAPKLGFTGIGIKQHGHHTHRYMHLDDLPEELPKQPRPHIWSYS